MGQRPTVARAVHSLYQATAWDVDSLACEASVSLQPDATEQVTSGSKRCRLLNATTDLSVYPGAEVTAGLRQ
jgi:hypothetical protein